MKTLLTTISCSVLSFTALAADPSFDKSQYSLFNRTPDDHLRPMMSDETDKVTSPYTVDAGHFQIEADLFNYFRFTESFDSPGFHVDYKNEELTWRPRFKVGLCNRVDLETAVEYEATSIHENIVASPSSFSGTFGANSFTTVTPKLKINLIGNDDGCFALAVAPYLSIPTGNGHISGGVQLPFAIKLPAEFQLKIAPGFSWYQDGFGDVSTAFDNSASLSHSIYGKLDGFAAISTAVTTEVGRDWQGYAGFGAVYNFTSNMQAYAGMRFGLTSASFDYNPYLGINWRF